MTEPRLLGLDDAAAYLGGSPSSVRALVMQGELTPVRLPGRTGAPSRRLLFDRVDLDRLIEAWKLQSTPEPNAQLSQAAIKGWRSSPERFGKGRRSA